MALERDELEKRRRQREQQRKARRAAQRRLYWKLGIAAVLLVACGVGIYLVSTRNAPASPVLATQPPFTSPLPQQQATEATEPRSSLEKPPSVIHIAAAGDLNVTDKVVWSGQTSGEFDYTNAFMDVAPVFSAADLALLNFEGNVSGAPYGTESASAPPQMIDALRNAGVDLVQMANSYPIHNGLIGLQSSLAAIRASGIEPLGAYTSTQEFRKTRGYTICQVGDIKVAVVAFTKGVGSLGLPAGSEDCVNLLYKDYYTNYKEIDTDGITKVLKAAKSEKPDFTIAMVHWGSSDNDTIYATQESIVKLMQKNGVDAIIGTHPHRLQKIDYDEKTGKLVAYSLGDFFGDAKNPGTAYSVILDLEVTKDHTTGKTRITGVSYTPIYTLSEDECDGNRRVVRIENAMAAYDLNFIDKVTDAAYENMKFALDRIPKRLWGEPEKDKTSSG